MKQTIGWARVLVLAGSLIFAASCDSDSSSGGGTTNLTVGFTNEESIDASDTNSYKFTTDFTSIHHIFWDTVSTGDATTLEMTSAEPFVCSVVSAANMKCVFSNTLDADTTYEFDITEISGVDTTHRLGVAIGS